MKNYYKVLDIPPNACSEEIKQAYKRLAAKYSSDKSTEDRYAGSRLMDISIAYNTLINPDKRKDYDRILNCIISTPAYRAGETTSIPHHAENVAVAQPIKRKAVSTHIAISLFILLISALAWANMALTTQNKTYKRNEPVQNLSTTKPTQKSVENQTSQPLHTSPPINPIKVIYTSTAERKKEILAKKEKDVAQEVNVTEARNITYTGEDLYLKKGQTYNQVLQIQGTPSSIIKPEDSMESWYYGSSMVNFKNGRLTSIENRGLNLLLPPKIVKITSE